MEDKCSAQSESSTEETGFEDNVVSRRGLAGRAIGCGCAIGRPVVVREHERCEIDLTRQLKESLKRGGARIEGSRPRFYVRDIFETVRERLHQVRVRF
jgi:hypothetical protein